MKLHERRRYVRSLEGISLAAKALLSVLADHVRDDDWQCFLSYETAMRETAIGSKSTLAKAIAELEKLGQLRVVRPERRRYAGGPGKGKANTYFLLFPGTEKGTQVDLSDASKRYTFDPQKVQIGAVKGPLLGHQPLRTLREPANAAGAAHKCAPPRAPKKQENESHADKRRRQLLELAATFSISKSEAESEAAYLDRIERVNARRLEAHA